MWFFTLSLPTTNIGRCQYSSTSRWCSSRNAERRTSSWHNHHAAHVEVRERRVGVHRTMRTWNHTTPTQSTEGDWQLEQCSGICLFSVGTAVIIQVHTGSGQHAGTWGSRGTLWWVQRGGRKEGDLVSRRSCGGGFGSGSNSVGGGVAVVVVVVVADAVSSLK